MTSLLDKLILFVFCSMAFLINLQSTYAVVFCILAIILICVQCYFENLSLRLSIFAVGFIFSILFPSFCFFLPILAYDVYATSFKAIVFFSIIPISHYFHSSEIMYAGFILVLFLLSYIFQYRSHKVEERANEFHELRDEIIERQYALEKANRELLEKQEYEIHLATLRERDRISQELHDSIGHVLTRSILLTGSLFATCTDPVEKESLTQLKESLSLGMGEIRASIHDMHDGSVDFVSEIREVANNFTFCPVKIRDNLDNFPGKQIRNTFLYILKEALTNVARHSNATEVSVTLKEHPILYQMIIHDNGTSTKSNTFEVMIEGDGMGLDGMRKRVALLCGNIVFRNHAGFEIFVSIPKKSNAGREGSGSGLYHQ